MTPEPLPPPWAKPGGHEPGPDFKFAKGTGYSLWPASTPPDDLRPGGDRDDTTREQ